MPPVLQTINKATGYTPDLGFAGNTVGKPYSPAIYQHPNGPIAAPAVNGGIPTASNGDPNAQFNAIMAQINAMSAPSPTAHVPYFDLAANASKARAAAESAVNPLYVQKLNDFLSRQQTLMARSQADAATSKAQIDKALQNTLEASQINRDRTAEDTQTNIDQVNNNAQNFQADTGTAFDKARNTLAGNTYQAGLTGSGLGAQQAADAVKQRNTQEGRQVQTFNVQKKAQELFKTRTFDDLAKADTNATDVNAKSKAQVNLNLDRYIEDLQTSEKQQRQSLEQERLQSLLGEQQRQEGLGVNKFLSTLGGQDLLSARAAYG